MNTFKEEFEIKIDSTLQQKTVLLSKKVCEFSMLISDFVSHLFLLFLNSSAPISTSCELFIVGYRFGGVVVVVLGTGTPITT